MLEIGKITISNDYSSIPLTIIKTNLDPSITYTKATAPNNIELFCNKPCELTDNFQLYLRAYGLDYDENEATSEPEWYDYVYHGPNTTVTIDKDKVIIPYDWSNVSLRTTNKLTIHFYPDGLKSIYTDLTNTEAKFEINFSMS